MIVSNAKCSILSSESGRCRCRCYYKNYYSINIQQPISAQKSYTQSKKIRKKLKKKRTPSTLFVIFRLRSLTFGVYFNSTQYSLNSFHFFSFVFRSIAFIRSVTLSTVCECVCVIYVEYWLDLCVVYFVYMSFCHMKANRLRPKRA